MIWLGLSNHHVMDGSSQAQPGRGERRSTCSSCCALCFGALAHSQARGLAMCARIACVLHPWHLVWGSQEVNSRGYHVHRRHRARYYDPAGD